MNELPPKQNQYERFGLSSETAKILSRVDIDKLRELFEEEAEKSGLEKWDIDLVESAFSDVNVRDVEEGRGGGYNSADRSITIMNREAFDRFMKKGTPYELHVLSVFFHEQTHAASRTSHYADYQVGYQQEVRFEGESSLRLAFVLFNEAITDLISEEIFHEYERRYGFTNEENPDSLEKTEYVTSYNFGRTIVKQFIEKVARECEVPEQTVWQGIKRSFFGNEDLLSTEFRALFGETVDEKLLMQLAKMEGEISSEALAVSTKLFIDNWSASLKERWVNLLSKKS